MGTFLDMRSSMNSATAGLPGVSISNSPVLFGIIGLQTQGVSNPLITFAGTIGVIGEPGDSFVVEIVRGSVYTPANVIYRAEATVGEGVEFHSFTAQDLNVPPALESVYSSFISGVSTATRTGPEVFYGIASTN
ncbi:hypothetical protein [Paenibacillus sp. Z3-2]